MVVGGGAIGVCVAFELARRGAEVTLLERGEELASGASSGNAGLLCPSHSAPIANPDSVRNGLRWMLKPDSPFYLRPRPSVAPWLARFVKASTAARASSVPRRPAWRRASWASDLRLRRKRSSRARDSRSDRAP